MTLAWKPDWPQAQQRLMAWWRGEGLVVAVRAPRREPIPGIAPPPPVTDHAMRWTDPQYRLRAAEYQMATTWYGGDAFPYFDTQIGPGSLGIMLGATPHFDPDTVWYEPCISDPDRDEPLTFPRAGNPWFGKHLALVDAGLAAAGGRYLVGIPDLIENIDTLAALRGNEALLVDLIERPAWVHRRLEEITRAYADVFDRLYARVVPASDGGNAFSAFHIWGKGKTAKVQCDFSCMISPSMFAEFVAPYLVRQCARLDQVLYHLDGTQAVQHVDALLALNEIHAIQWTPQAGRPGPGAPVWYDLFRRIRAGGKSVQALRVTPEEAVPLLDAVGPKGVFMMVYAESQDAGEQLLERLEPYRRDGRT